MVFLRRLKTAIKLIKGKRWGYFKDKLPMYKKIISITNLFPHPNKYKYILLGGHGLGMTALKYYLDKLGASPKEILSYEIVRAFVFYENFDGLSLDKSPLNSDINSIMKKCNKKVPIYQIVRCPIEVIKSNINVQMFHALSKVNSKEDSNDMLFKLVNNIPHLMFYFKSMRNLVNHMAMNINYITMKDINDENIYSTLQKFANEIGYNYENIANRGGQQESAIKGSLFPRCFPQIFNIEGSNFIISTYSRLNTNSIKEIDMGGDVTQIRKPYIGPYYAIDENIIVKGYEAYPLILASIDNKNNALNINKAKEYVNEYIDYVINSIAKHNNFIFDENEVIDTLLKDRELALNIARKMNDELFYIKKEIPEIFDSFKYTKQFLEKCNIDFRI